MRRKRARVTAKPRTDDLVQYTKRARNLPKPVTNEENRDYLPPEQRPIQNSEMLAFRAKLAQTYEMPKGEERITPAAMLRIVQQGTDKNAVGAAKVLVAMRKLTVDQAKLLMGLGLNTEEIKFIDVPDFGLPD